MAPARIAWRLAAVNDVIATKKPGDKIQLAIVRGTSRRTLSVTLGRQP